MLATPEQVRSEESALEEKLASAKAVLLDEYGQDHQHPWIVGYSGGKDSTLTLQLVFEMLLDMAPGDRRREVHVVANDTLVESPLLSSYVERMLEKLRTAADTLRLPLHVVKTTPAPNDTFWVNLIGKGYPAPSRSFRWCTDRMKIQPTSQYIKSKVAEAGQTILLLGVRASESSARAKLVKNYSAHGRLNPHNDLQGCWVFRPIVDFTTEEVWQTLLQRRPPWGGTHRELVTLYRNAQGGECPLVIDQSQAPSCGTSSSRFGCWTCTVVTKDRSMEGFIEAGHPEFEPLLDFRDWLANVRNDYTRRQAHRRNGNLTFQANGSLVPGPFTIDARREILDKLLATQEEVGIELISSDEIERIKATWAGDLVASAAK